MNTEDKLREALEQIANFSDVEMGDGDGARKVALEALAAAAPSEPVRLRGHFYPGFTAEESHAENVRVYGDTALTDAEKLPAQPSAKPAGAVIARPDFLPWVTQWFGPNADYVHIANALRALTEVEVGPIVATLPAARAGLTDAEIDELIDRFEQEATDYRTGNGHWSKRLSARNALRAILASTPAPVKSDVEFELRWMLACRISGVALYTDDGELQDNSVHPFIDFKRDTPQQIREALLKRANTAPVMAVAPEAGGFVRLSKHSDHGKPYRAFTHAQEQARAELAPAIAALIVRDVCETDPADPADPNTVSVNVDVLSEIVSSNLTAPPAAQGAPAMAEAASLETALVTQFGSTTEYDELICAIWAAQPHYFRNREQSLEKARGLLAAATRKGQP